MRKKKKDNSRDDQTVLSSAADLDWWTAKRTSQILRNKRFEVGQRFDDFQFVQVDGPLVLIGILLFDNLQRRFLIGLFIQFPITATLRIQPTLDW